MTLFINTFITFYIHRRINIYCLDILKHIFSASMYICIFTYIEVDGKIKEKVVEPCTRVSGVAVPP